MMTKNISTALDNIDLIVGNVPMIRSQHVQLVSDIALVSGECAKVPELEEQVKSLVDQLATETAGKVVKEI